MSLEKYEKVYYWGTPFEIVGMVLSILHYVELVKGKEETALYLYLSLVFSLLGVVIICFASFMIHKKENEK